MRDPGQDGWFGNAQTANERRRPGRPVQVSPALIPLLRRQIDPDMRREEALGMLGNPDQLRAVTGLAVSLVLSGMLWAGMVSAVLYVFG